MLPLVLASTSFYRKQLLEKLGLPFIQAAPNIDESPLDQESASTLVERLAREKALALTENHPNSLIIGSDQAATFDGRIIGKPHTKDNAQKQLKGFSGQKITFYTGLALHNTATGETKSLVEPFHVYFRKLSDQHIARYIEKENPLDCAGSFKSEGMGVALFEKLEGRDPNTLIGLPLIALCDLLHDFGISPLD
ncbi:Maf family protein [Oceanospirillum linum]|uniref:7-methyl-GTP pyrophosphatase n=1 Tax=Oceanospirillum linum TaxID=966 RepID=A0A1T1HEU9_OCELI|nr:nucleoside triphosphate pyrophosphatase [Oceanospirillum linum]OOV88260.1 septum formation inhibitor Maf [Oceanospirillum linum]SEF50065.1 MAF protein [Oleiphilus messinensis]SMP03738.1 MAF protein [Oceanospirillum linum]